jgi:RimJ/RimL family protein N-acetyltransferase
MTERRDAALVRLEIWAEGDLELLRLTNSVEMMAHLGGPESEEQLLARHRRYLDVEGAGTGRMFSVVLLPEGEAVGTVGYWERNWQGETVYEMGWGVLPRYQGRGIAVAAAPPAIDDAAARRTHTSLHAYPSVDHPASNAICRKAGFTLVSACDFEYPPGHPIRCNDWRVDLTAAGRPRPAGA